MKKTTLFRWIGLLFLGIGILFMAQPLLKGQLAQSTSAKVIEENPITMEGDPKAEYDFQTVKPLSWKDIWQAHQSSASTPPIGIIQISELDLELPIFPGVSNTNLAAGVGTMNPSQEMGRGNYALAGHYVPNQNVLFSPLHDASLGMMIDLFDGKNHFTYEITNMTLVSPDQTDVLNETKDATLTLVTCNFDGSERLIVTGELIKIK